MRENYKNLQPLRIPEGWTVGLNKFEDIDPETLSAGNKVWLYAFNEDILQISCKLKRKRNDDIEKQELIIDLGWYPDSDPNGSFTLLAILNENWDKPLLKFSSRSKDEIVKTLEKWLFVDFMPTRYYR